MNKLKVVQGSGLGIVEHWNWLQDGIKKAFEHVLSNLTAESPMFRISGATVTEGDPEGGQVEVSITGGAICFNGEPVEVVAHSVTRTVEQVAWIGIEEVAVDTTPVLNQTTGQGDSVMKRRRGVLTLGSNYPAPGTYCPIDAPTMNEIYSTLVSGRTLQLGDILPISVTPQQLSDWYDSTGLGIVDTPGEKRAICNGNNGTIDLRGLAMVGAVAVPSTGAEGLPDGVESNYSPGAVFGKESHVLESDEMPIHDHSYSDERLVGVGGSSGVPGDGGGAFVQSTGKTTGPAGGGQAHENRQPSRALIMVQVID